MTAILARWHQNTRYFYEPTPEILRELGETYKADPAFRKTFIAFHADLPDYLQTVISRYVDDLEHAEIVRMLAQEEDQRQTR